MQRITSAIDAAFAADGSLAARFPNSPAAIGNPCWSLVTYVKDRPGHDRRYAIDARKISAELGWKPAETFETGMRKTVCWYLDHQDWVADVTSGNYRDWIAKHYG